MIRDSDFVSYAVSQLAKNIQRPTLWKRERKARNTKLLYYEVQASFRSQSLQSFDGCKAYCPTTPRRYIKKIIKYPCREDGGKVRINA